VLADTIGYRIIRIWQLY